MVVARSAAVKKTADAVDARPTPSSPSVGEHECGGSSRSTRVPRANALYRDSRLRASRFENDSVGRRLPRSRGGPFAMEKGKAARTFRELTTASPQAPVGLTPISPDLPGPGVYFLVSVWPPHVLDPLDPATPEWLRRKRAGRFGNLSGNTRSLPVRIEIGPVSDGQ